MKQQFKFILITTIAAAVFGLSAHAQNAGSSQGTGTTGSGIGSTPESGASTGAASLQNPQELFRQLDTDGDQRVTRQEFGRVTTILGAGSGTGTSGTTGTSSSGTDATTGTTRGTTATGSSGSGTSRALSDPDSLFARLDTDKDGALTKTEFMQISTAVGGASGGTGTNGSRGTSTSGSSGTGTSGSSTGGTNPR